MTSLGSGLDNLHGSLLGTVALTGRELGIDWMNDLFTNMSEEQLRQAAASDSQRPEFTDIESAGGFFKWAAGSLGEAIPSLGFAMAGGGVGGVMARSAVTRSVKRAVARKVERDLVKKGFGQAESLEAVKGLMNTPTGQRMVGEAFVSRVGRRFAPKAVPRGQAGGAASVAALPQIGAIDRELREHGIDAGFTAVVGGVVGGALEAIPAVRFMDKLFPGVDRTVSKAFVKDFAAAAGTQAALEGSTEAAQEMIQLAALAYHDPSFDMFDADAKNRVINAFAAGALVGAVTGGVGSTVDQGLARGEAGIEQTAEKAKAAAKRAKVQIEEWQMDDGDAGKDTFEDGFRPADNTFYQEVRDRVFAAVQPKIEAAVNGLSNQTQRVIDIIDESMAGGANEDTEKFSDIVRKANAQFFIQHGAEIKAMQDYLKRETRRIAETVQTIRDPEAREKYILQQVEIAKQKVAAGIDRLRQAAARRDEKTEAEFDDIDFDNEIIEGFEDVGRRDQEPDTTERRTGPSGRAFDRPVGPEPQATESPVTVSPSDAAPDRFVFGKHQKQDPDAPGYKDEAEAQNALEKTVTRMFPSAEPDAFEIRQRDDGTFEIAVKNIGDSEALNDDFNAFEGAKAARQSAEGSRQPHRQYKPKGKAKLDLITLAHRGRNLIHSGRATMTDGLKAMQARMLESDEITNEDVQPMLDKFATIEGMKDPTIQLDLQAPPTEFPTAAGARFAMNDFLRQQGEKGRLLPKKGVIGVVKLPNGRFTFGIANKPGWRAYRASQQKTSIDIIADMAQDRRLHELGRQTRDPADAGPGSPRIGLDRVPTQQQPQQSQRKTARGKPIEEPTVTREAVVPGGRDTTPAADDPIFRDTSKLPSEVEDRRAELARTPENERAGVVEDPREGTIRGRKSDKRIEADLKQTRRIMKQRGKVKVLISDLVDPDGAIQKGVKGIVKFAQNTLGLVNPVVVMDSRGLANLIETGLVTDPIFQKTLDENPHARNIRLNDVSYIFLSDRVLAKTGSTVIAMGHELGHQLYSVAWDQLTPAKQEALRRAYIAARGGDGTTTVTKATDAQLKEIRRLEQELANELGVEDRRILEANNIEEELDAAKNTGIPQSVIDRHNKRLREIQNDLAQIQVIKRKLGKQLDHARSKVSVSTEFDEAGFSEWMADQLATWIVKRAVPGNPVEAFFHRVGAKIRQLYEFIAKSDRFRPDETFTEFADAVADRARGVGASEPLAAANVKAWFTNEGSTGYKWWGENPKAEDMQSASDARVPQITDVEFKRVQESFTSKYPQIAKRAVLIRNWIHNAYTLVLAPSTSVVREIGKKVPVVKEIVSIFGRENHGEAKRTSNYHQRLRLMQAQFMEGDKGFQSITKAIQTAVESEAKGRQFPNKRARNKWKQAREFEIKRDMIKGLRSKEGDPDAQFSKQEQALRDLFDRMHDYAVKNGLPVRKVRNYFPRQFSREALIKNKQKILDHLQQTGLSLEKARAFYNSLIDPRAQDGRETIDPVSSPAFDNMNSRRAQDKFFDQFLDENLDGIVSNYVNALTKRAEFNRVLGEDVTPVAGRTPQSLAKSGEWDPKGRYNAYIKQMQKEGATDEQITRVQQYIDANLGQLGRDDVGAGPRKFMAGVMAYQNMRVLLFTVFASLPDLVGPSIRGGGMRKAFRTTKKYIREIASDESKLAEAARVYGIISSEANNHIMTEYVDNHYMPPTLRKWNDAFFKWTGLNWYTDFTRKMALSVGIDYIQQQADKAKNGKTEKERFQAQEALAELGIDEGFVTQWVQRGKPGLGTTAFDADSKIDRKVGEALTQFVDESIMRPNAAQRPLLASHPAAMLVFHLKGYLYAVHEVVLKRMKYNVDEAEGAAQTMAALSPALAMMLLTAIGLELREVIQYAGTNRQPPTDRMDGWEYTWELIERAGLPGIWQLGFDAQNASDRGMSEVAGLAGPTLSQAGQLLSRPHTQTIPKGIPIASQIPALRDAVRTVL
jgi:hypothetical protein